MGRIRATHVIRTISLSCLLATSTALAGTATSIKITRAGPDPSLAGQGIVVFTHLDAPGGEPTGTITVSDGTHSCTATLPETACLYQPQSPGTKSLTASYSGDMTFDSSTSPSIDHEVVAASRVQRVSIPDGFGRFGPLVEGANAASSTASAASVSDDGRLIAFASEADNLVPGDVNGFKDVFVQDRLSGTITRISVDRFGIGGNGPSTDPAISGDGQSVVFASKADNLVAGDTNGVRDIFLHQLTTGQTDRISVDSASTEGDLPSSFPSISRFGQYVAFESSAPNLVPNDDNDVSDIFVRAVFDGTTERVSVDSGGTEANGPSGFASISADGQSVLFESDASNLVDDDNNTETDVFVHDRDTDVTARISISTTGVEGNGFSSTGSTRANLSADGQMAVFETQADNLVDGDTAGQRDILLRNRSSGTTTRVSVDPTGADANGFSENAAISADGAYVAFASGASNLVPDDGNGRGDIIVHDVNSGEKEIASLTSAGRQTFDESSTLPTLSSDGRFVAFQTDSAELINNDTNGVTDVFVRDRAASITLRASEAAPGTQGNDNTVDIADIIADAVVSSDGRFVAFSSSATNLVAGDTNDAFDVFVLDRDNGGIERVSVDSNEVQGNDISFQPAISDDGRFVAFISLASNLAANDKNETADIYVRDRNLGTTQRVSVHSDGTGADGFSELPSISNNGQFVAFDSFAANLVDDDGNGEFDVFVRDLGNGTTERVSLGPGGAEGDSFSFVASISDDGRFVAFESSAANLVDNDTNNMSDIFVHDRQEGSTERVSINSDGSEGTGGNQGAQRPELSGDGRFVTFEAEFTNLVDGDTNEGDDVFVHDRDDDTTERVSVDEDGNQIDGFSVDPAISRNGRFVVFTSVEPELDPDGPSNGFVFDVFVHDRKTGTVRLLSQNADGEATDGRSRSPRISANGRIATFQSRATNLVAGDSNQHTDAFAVETMALTLVTPGGLDFGGQAIGDTSAPQTVTVESDGPVELVLEAISIEGDDANAFDISSDGCSGQSLGTQDDADNDCQFEVTFTPESAGVYEAQVVIPSNSESSPDTVTLQGATDVLFFDRFESG